MNPLTAAALVVEAAAIAVLARKVVRLEEAAALEELQVAALVEAQTKPEGLRVSDFTMSSTGNRWIAGIPSNP